jgi:hypothetical protein
MTRATPFTLVLTSSALCLLVSGCAKPIPLRDQGVNKVTITLTHGGKGCTPAKPCTGTLDQANGAAFVKALKRARQVEAVKCAHVGTIAIDYASAATTKLETRCSSQGKLFVSDEHAFYALPRAPLVALGKAGKVDLSQLLP